MTSDVATVHAVACVPLRIAEDKITRKKNEIRGSISYGATFAVKKTLRAPATAPLDVLGWTETNYSLPTCYYCERAWTREAQIGQLNRQRKRCRNVID